MAGVPVVAPVMIVLSLMSVVHTLLLRWWVTPVRHNSHMSDNDTTPSHGLSNDDIAAAERLQGLEFTEAERSQLLARVAEHLEGYRTVRTISIGNEVPPALHFDPRPHGFVMPEEGPTAGDPGDEHADRPEPLEALAFWPLHRLAPLLKTRQLRSLELTELALSRLKRYDPALHCVVTLTETLALEQAERADAELDAGRWRGPLHGVPYGAKDLLAVPGYPTTWGAAPFREQRLDATATVVERLEQAGAVLTAKLSMGALAMGDVWFGGRTNSPWDLERGASGSSAGSGSAVAAGLVPFAIGTETLGSIVSPSTRCAVTGLRPTFGRVSRYGAMALSWSMDKIGPMARSARDCALVFAALHGPDGYDPTVVEAPFGWPSKRNLSDLTIGYVATAFEEERDTSAADDAFVETLRTLGAKLVSVALPELPVKHFFSILMSEAAAAFDELTRSGRDEELTRQGDDAWPNLIRAARFIPAVEYLQANRLRTVAIQRMVGLFDEVDVYLCPSSHFQNLVLTNITGHPSVAVPNAFNDDGSPADSSMTITGRLYAESDILAVAHAYQQQAGPTPMPALSRV